MSDDEYCDDVSMKHLEECEKCRSIFDEVYEDARRDDAFLIWGGNLNV